MLFWRGRAREDDPALTAPLRRVLLKEAWASFSNRMGRLAAGQPMISLGWWQKLDDRSFIPLRSLVPSPEPWPVRGSRSPEHHERHCF